MAANGTSFKPGNRAALKHGARAAKAPRTTRVRLRAQMRADLLLMKPEINAQELELGVGLLLHLQQVRDYIDSMGGIISTRGQVRACAGELDRLTGRWEAWCKRNGIGYGQGAPKGGGLTWELAQARQEMEAEQQQATRR